MAFAQAIRKSPSASRSATHAMTAAGDAAREGEMTMIETDHGMMTVILAVTIGAAVTAMIGMIVVTIVRENDMTSVGNAKKTSDATTGEGITNALSMKAAAKKDLAAVGMMTTTGIGPVPMTMMAVRRRKAEKSTTETVR